MQDVSNDSAQSHLLFNNNPATSQVSAIDFSELSSAFNTVLQVKGCPVALLDINGNVLACSDWPVTPSGVQPIAQFIAKNSEALCVTPITFIDEQVGSLFVGHYQSQSNVAANTLPDTIMQLLAPLASHIIKLNLLNAHYQHQLQHTEQQVMQRTQELMLQNQILNQISEGAELESVLHNLVTQVELLHPGTLCSILLLDEDSNTLRHGAAPSLPDEYNNALHGVSIGIGVGSCGTAAFTGETVIVEDICSHPYWQPYQALAKLAGVRACWSQPIKNVQNKVLGTFAIYHHQPATPGTMLLQSIKTYSNLAELAISRCLSAAQIRRLAFYDSLTGLANRRLLEEHLFQAIASSQRSQKYCGLMFIDLDNFKPVNDIYGHKTGDTLLVEVAQRLLGSVRAADTVARFGGDEFIVLVRDIDTETERSKLHIQQIATKIVQELARPYQLSDHIMHQCACSIGLVLFQGDKNCDELLRQADTAMYQAKRQGRNQPCWFSGE